MRVTPGSHPAVGELHLSASEARHFIDVAYDWHPTLSELPEAEAFDTAHALGEQARDELPELAEALDELETHHSWRTLVVNTPEPRDTELDLTPVRFLEPHENPRLIHDVHRQILLGMMGVYAYGYTEQQPFNIHNNVIATQDAPEHTSANPAELGAHIEDASFNLAYGVLPDGSTLGREHSVSPDWLTLHFLRNHDRVASTVFMPDFKKLPARIIGTLMTPFYINETSPLHGGDKTRAEVPVAVLYQDGDNLRMRLNADKIRYERYTPEQQEALHAVVDLTMKSCVDLALGPGAVALIDNHRAPHGRAAYKPDAMPRFDGTDRWQRRVVAADDAARIKPYEVAPRIVNPHLLLDHVDELHAATY